MDSEALLYFGQKSEKLRECMGKTGRKVYLCHCFESLFGIQTSEGTFSFISKIQNFLFLTFCFVCLPPFIAWHFLCLLLGVFIPLYQFQKISKKHTAHRKGIG